MSPAKLRQDFTSCFNKLFQARPMQPRLLNLIGGTEHHAEMKISSSLLSFG
jgi:hypothetical protein